MYHLPVLLNESIDGLNINPDGVYFDVTFGGGGHSREILNRLSEKGKLFSIDQDSDAHKNTIDDPRFTLIYGNFRYIKHYVDYYNLDKVDGILADFGVSSHQFDIEGRGFSFRLGGPLDMRMNTEQTLTASDILNTYEDTQLYKIFKSYCDINNPGKLVNLILSYRKTSPFENIETFIETIKPATPQQKENKYLAQVFQALRIEVNDEIGALNEFLNSCPDVLAVGGRLSAISYHSLEDRPVKNLIKSGNTEGKIEKDIFGRANLPLKAVNRKIIIPSESEIETNSRAKSAKLRIAEKSMSESPKITKQNVKATIRGLVNGSIVASDVVRKQIPFIIVLFVLGLVYISNRFHAEQVFRETEETQKQIEDLRAEKIEIQKELMTNSRSGQVLRLLEEKGSTLIDPTTPPRKISYTIETE